MGIKIGTKIAELVFAHHVAVKLIDSKESIEELISMLKRETHLQA